MSLRFSQVSVRPSAERDEPGRARASAGEDDQTLFGDDRRWKDVRHSTGNTCI